MNGSSSQAGFHYQNNVAALKIIDCLFFGNDISHIFLENYDKGNHIDDIIIYKHKSVEYYQVKWSQGENNPYTLYNLIASQPSKKSILGQLADGYRSVLPLKIDQSIILFTTRKESNQKKPSDGILNGLADIRKNIIDPLKQSSEPYYKLSNFDKYASTLEMLRLKCNLDKKSFNVFLKKLVFCFSQESLEQIRLSIKSKLTRLGIEQALFEKLLDLVVKWSISGEKITKSLLIEQLGISDRFEDKLSHHFKIVDEKYYVHNTDLASRIESAVSKLSGGYIFIEGLPGIGKSTALTKFKQSNPDVALTYYCFIPDPKYDFGDLRHRSNYFFKSLCVAIEKQFINTNLPQKYSDNFEEKLVVYLEKLGSLNRKIIFVIDGLDHVHRNHSLGDSSLLNYITGRLPDNIFFILSSQYKAVLSNSVLSQIESDQTRHIVVNRFDQRAILQYFKNKELDIQDELSVIERLSEGIPLYLHYISELLLKSNKRSYKSVLRMLPTLVDGEINSYHEHLFRKINRGGQFGVWTLAVLAYRKEHSNPEVISEILRLAGLEHRITDVYDVIGSLSHLLRPIDGRSYTIFHNSFREFIISKTGDLKDRFNEALILYYEKNQFTDEAYRNYFRHLFDVGNYKKIVESTHIEWMKSAWKNFRTLEEIKNNLDIALDACVESIDLSGMVRLTFLRTQFSRLSWNLNNSDADFPLLLLSAGETANSLRSVWDGDFVLKTKEYFCYYLIEYYLKTGNLLPQAVLD